MNALSKKFLKAVIAVLTGAVILSASFSLYFAQEEDIPESDTEIPEEEPVYDTFYRPGMVSAGLFHTLALNEAGEVYAWGDNSQGQLGIGEAINEEIPMQVEGLNDIIMVSAGDYHSLALTSSGDVYAWGRNSFGQLGNGDTHSRTIPVRVDGLPPITQISAGGTHSMALGIDGNVYAWGMNSKGQVGNVDSEVIYDKSGNVLGTRVSVPVMVTGPGIVSISAGGSHSLCLDELGRVFAWGSNDYGQLGDGTYISRAQPEQVRGLGAVSCISAGYFFNLSVSQVEDEKTGEYLCSNLYSWGSNSSGQLGIGMDEGEEMKINIPERVDITNDLDMYNDDISGISAGYLHAVITVPSREEEERENIYLWGNNDYGQLGIGEMPSQNSPVKLIATSDGWTGDSFLPFSSISAGGYHTVLLSIKGFAGVAGRADKSQLGNVSIIHSDLFIGVKLKDSISPEWEETAKLKMNGDGKHLELEWPEARDNLWVAGYRLNYLLNGEPRTRLVKDSLELSISDFDPSEDQVLLLEAFDEEGNVSSRPLEYTIGDPVSKLEEENEDVLRETTDSYFPELVVFNPIAPLEVPWDTDYIYGDMTVDPPEDQSIWIAAGITGSVVLFFIFLGLSGFKRNHKGHSIIRGLVHPETHKDKQHKEEDAKSIDIAGSISIVPDKKE